MLTYVPKDVTVTIAGLLTIEGFIDGSFIEMKKEVASYTYNISMDGETSRTFRKDSTYKMTITLAQTSESNDVLSTIHQADLISQLGKFPIFVKDNQGTTRFFSTNAWIEGFPSVVFSNGMEGRQWTIYCTNCGLFAGGAGNDSTLSDVLSVTGLITGVLS